MKDQHIHSDTATGEARRELSFSYLKPFEGLAVSEAISQLDLPSFDDPEKLTARLAREVIIDLNTPRPQWYLDINPRGLVPSIKYSVPGVYDEEEIITESAIVSQFLMDSFPSHLLPESKQEPMK